MSTHKSLRTKGSLVRSRNVLTRYERILQLRKSGRWKEDEAAAAPGAAAAPAAAGAAKAAPGAKPAAAAKPASGGAKK